MLEGGTVRGTMDEDWRVQLGRWGEKKEVSQVSGTVGGGPDCGGLRSTLK